MEGVCKDDEEVWPYNSMSGLLIAWVGDVSVTVFDEDCSNAAGSDVVAYLSKLDVSKMSKEEKQEQQAKWSTVLLKEGMCLWVPFGCVTSIVPLASRRESKTEVGEKKKRPGRSAKKDETEYSTFVFIPVLGDKDAGAVAKTVCQVFSRWTAHKLHGPERWENSQKNSDWKSYCDALEVIVKKTSKKIADDGDASVELSAGKAAESKTADVGAGAEGWGRRR